MYYQDQTFLVDFKKYCKLCKYETLDEVKDPCNECLAHGGNLNSQKPLYFESKTKED